MRLRTRRVRRAAMPTWRSPSARVGSWRRFESICPRPRRRGDRMSNCVVAVAEWPTVRAASRLTLRVPALRAAAALTRLTRWASGLSCGRQDVPADRTVDPRYIVAKHRVEDGDDLTHHSDEDDLGFLSGGREAIVEGSELGIATVADQSRHVEHAPHRSTAAPDAAHPLEPAAVKVVGRNSDQRRNLLAVHLSEFWQQGEERDGQHRA